MRTTLTLDDDVAASVRRLMTDRGISFKEAVNVALRAGLTRGSDVRVELPSFAMGEPRVDLDGSLRLADQIEDDELVRRLAVGR